MSIIVRRTYSYPFNSITTIEFALPQPEDTTFTIYNILSAEVVTLVSYKLQAGVHKYHFDGRCFQGCEEEEVKAI